MQQSSFVITANYVDVFNRAIYLADMTIQDGKIRSIERLSGSVSAVHRYVIPGFIDAHVHIESSMLIPSEFARLAVVHGTVGTVSDPHEIANVCGLAGVQYMLDDAKRVPFKFCFGAPSCVPATLFETSGAVLGLAAVKQLLEQEEIGYLTEVMNYPGVLNGDAELIGKIEAAKILGKPVDGHAPGLRGKDVLRYAAAGITTDHECFTKEEALDKLNAGMIVQIREGSAAKNFDALIDLLEEHYETMMFCSDDKHPDNLLEGHINQLCARAIAKGLDIFKVLRVACINPVKHYGLKVGLLQENDQADFVLVDDLNHFRVFQTYINGILVAQEGRSLLNIIGANLVPVNNFNCLPKQLSDFLIPDLGRSTIRVIEVFDGQLVTGDLSVEPKQEGGYLVQDMDSDLLKICVINRYEEAKVAVAFIKNFGLKKGALASSIAHDSHNIIAVGCDDDSLMKAVNLVIANKGGISYSGEGYDLALALPIAGIMTEQRGEEVANSYIEIDKKVKDAGCSLTAPFMSLSFMALLVIPSLKLSDKGLFDGKTFSFVDPA